MASLRGDYDAGRADFQRVPRLSSQAPRRLLCAPTALPGADATARQLAGTIAVASGRTVSVVVYDNSLHPLIGAGLPRLSPPQLAQALSGAETAPEVVDTADGSRLLVGFPIQIGTARPCGIAQLSVPMQPVDDVLTHERLLLAGSGGAALVLALCGGLFLIRRALRPLLRLTDAAGRLARGDLRARSRLNPRSDEVGTLARSFDDMADRIESAFSARAESEARVRRFIADASHELRTPITGLKGYIDVLRRGAAHDPQALSAALEAMSREADRMRTLVLDLLTLARIDAAPSAATNTGRAGTRDAVDLNAVVAAVLDEAGPGMPDTLVRNLGGSPLTVLADGAAVATIVRNLLVNAGKYAPGATQVWSTARDGNWAVLSAADSGPGIPAADLPHVFERFYRGEKMRAREDGGSGLGLSIVRGLARAQGGEVAIASREGEGTTVTVRFPLARGPGASEVEGQQ